MTPSSSYKDPTGGPRQGCEPPDTASTSAISPYHKPGFYSDALAKGRHRDIVGGRWEETGLVQMQILLAAGLDPDHHFLDIGAGSLRLGCRLVPYMAPNHYWATDLSGDLLRRGYDLEITDKSRLSPDHLIEDADFSFPGLPDSITMAIAFGVFTHLPAATLRPALANLRLRCPALRTLLLTVFLAPKDAAASHRQPDGVVTHANRPPYHRAADAVTADATAAGFAAEWCDRQLPRGQRLCVLAPG